MYALVNEYLSICIPTYNRSNRLRGCLEQVLPQVMKFCVPVFVSDNYSTDDTPIVVAEFRQRYPFIFYNRNDENIGPDRNFEFVLKMARSRYRWLLSDDDRIIDGGIETVLNVCMSEDYDLILLNGGNFRTDDYGNVTINGRVTDVTTRLFTDRSDLLSEVGWHMQLISCLVFGSGMVDGADFEKYRNTFLVQFGAILSYLSTRDIKVYWLKEPLVFSDSNEPTASWLKNTFEIFAENWTQLILALPDSYTEEAKIKCIKDHGKKGGLFTARGFVYLRSNSIIDVDIYYKYLKYLEYVTDVPKPVVKLISKVPVNCCKNFEKMYRNLIVVYHKIRGVFH